MIKGFKEKVNKDPELFLVISVISLIAGLAIGYFVFSAGQPAGNPPAGQEEIGLSDAEISSKLGAYLSDNSAALFGGEFDFEISDINKVGDALYSVIVSAEQDGESMGEAVFFVTPDNKYLILGSVLDLDEEIPSAEETPEENPEDTAGLQIPQAETPEIDIFVMSFCPYGIKAEYNFGEVLGLLEGKVNYKFHYLLNTPEEGYSGYEGTYCYGGYCSMHGAGEVTEDLRQICIREKYPDKWYGYVDYVRGKYDADEWTASNIDDVWQEAAEAAGLDAEAIQQCFDEEGAALLEQEYSLQQDYATKGSPSVFINGVYWQGAVMSSTATPDGYREGICSAFLEAPEDCSAELSAEAAAGGSC